MTTKNTAETLEQKALHAYNGADPKAFESCGDTDSARLRQLMNAYCAIQKSAQHLYPRASPEQIAEITNHAMNRSLNLKRNGR